MKKLLALILCVMMFVAVIPTAAFAGGLPVDDPLLTAKEYQKHIENMIKNTKTNVENSYKSLVGNQVVYTSAKAMDDSVVSLVDAIANPLIEKGKFDKVWADFCKDAIRFHLDKVVAKKIVDDGYKALDKDGNRDELKYAQLIADSINSALTDKNFIAGYQAVATNFALRSLVADMSKEIDDQYKAFREGVDSSFEKKFAEKYTTLVDDYIDTFATRTAKIANNNAAWDILQDALEDAQDDYDAIVDPLADTLEDDIEDAKTQKDADIAAAKAPVTTAEGKVKDAEKALAKAEIEGDAAKIQKAKDDLKDAQDDLKDAEKQYNKDVKDINEAYDDKIEDLNKQFAIDTFDAQWDYDEAVEKAEDTFNKAVEYINPWALYELPEVGSWS